MVAFRDKVEGGHLAIPEYNIGLEIADLSLTFFAGQEVLHGVTPFHTNQGGYRYTLVYYTMNQMWKCEDVSTEVARIRQRKTTREWTNICLRRRSSASKRSSSVSSITSGKTNDHQRSNCIGTSSNGKCNEV